MTRIFLAAATLTLAALTYLITSARPSPAAPPPSHATAPAPVGTGTAAPAAPPRHPGEEVKADLESLDLEIQTQLVELERLVAEFSGEQQKWKSLDKSMATARVINKSLLVRNKSVVDLYETKLSAPLERFRERLKAAPAIYRKMADERRALHALSSLDVEKRNYLAMAETCEAAAALCERRLEELFGITPAEKSGKHERRANVLALRETIANMKKLQPMHEKWEETLSAYPSALEDPKLSNWFDTLSLYGEDLDAFTKSVEALKDAMKKKAEAPKDAEPKKPAEMTPREKPGVDDETTVPIGPAEVPDAGPAAAATPNPARAVAKTPPPAITYTAYRTRDGRILYVPNR